MWVSLGELRSSVCERRLERTILRTALLPVKTAQFTQFFRQVRRHTVKSLILIECIGRLTCYELAHVDSVCSVSVCDFLCQIRKHIYINVIFSRYVIMKDSNQLFPQQY